MSLSGISFDLFFQENSHYFIHLYGVCIGKELLDLGLSYMVSGTRENPFFEATLYRAFICDLHMLV